MTQGRNPEEGASWATFAIIHDLMQSLPEELDHAFLGFFPRSDPYTVKWDQSKGKSLVRDEEEQWHSDSKAMSGMYAMIKRYANVEQCF